MNAFVAKHRPEIKGVLHCFDRVILRGHLPIAGTGYFLRWLTSKQVALNLNQLPEGWWNFKDAAPWFAETLKNHAHALAAERNRPYRHLPAPSGWRKTLASWPSKTKSSTDWCASTGDGNLPHLPRAVQRGRSTRSDQRVCLVIYYYWMDREFGLMHVKLQTWFPFTVQVYVNGHEWLARKLTARGTAFDKLDNAFVELADAERPATGAGILAARVAKAARSSGQPGQSPAHGLAGRPELLLGDRPGRVFHRRAVCRQDRARLIASRSVRARGALFWRGTGDDVFRTEVFAGRFQGEVRTHWRRREPGAAVKHWVKSNAIKMYDKGGRVLRIETVINEPKEFFVHRPRPKHDGGKVVGWFAMNKGVANLYRYAQVSQRANDRYLEALAVVNDVGVGQRELDWRCAPVSFQGRRRRGLQPLSRDDQALFQAVLRGEHAVRGFRNGEVAERLYGPRPKDPAERRRRSGRVSRRISLLRAHGLVAKYPRSRRYRVTRAGQRFMSTAIHVRAKLFTREFGQAE